MGIDVFISHHTKTSLKITEAICNSLESQKIRCWYAPRDTAGAYAQSIVNAINECKVFVLVLNKEASYSEDVLNEINMAFERLRAGENISIIPFHISSDEISADAKYYLGRIHWIDAIEPPMADRIEELTIRVGYLLGKEINKKNNIERNQLKSSIILPNNNFIGRKNELEKIHEELHKSSKIFLQGMGGIGKSEISKMYAQKYKEEYDIIIFAHYQTNIKNMIISEKDIKIENFLRQKNEDGTIESDDSFYERKLEKLKQLSTNKTLIIVDNFDTENDEELNNFLDGIYNVIFTTRNDFEYLGLPVIHIGAMESKEDRMNLFSYNYKKLITKPDEEIILKIMEVVQGHTLAIELIAKLMITKRIHPDKMLEILQTQGISNLTGNINHSFEKTNTVYGYVRMLFNMSSLDENEKYVMENLSLFPNSGFALEEFAQMCDIEDCEYIDMLIRKSWILYDISTDNIALHPLISDIVRVECEVSLEKCEKLLNNLSKISSKSWSMSKEDRVKYGEIVKSVYMRFPNIEIKYTDNYNEMVRILKDLEYYQLSEKIARDNLKLRIENYGEFSEPVGMNYYEIGDIYLAQNKYEETVEYGKKAVEIMKKVSPNSLNAGYVLKFLSFGYTGLKQYDNVEDVLKQCHEIFEKVIDEKHPQMASLYAAEGNLFYAREDYDKAMELSEKSYEIFYELNGKIDLDTAAPMRTIYKIYMKTGRYNEAVKIQEEVLDISKHFFDNTHYRILSVYVDLIEAYIKNGNPEKAKENLLILKENLEKRNDTESDYYKYVMENLEKI